MNGRKNIIKNIYYHLSTYGDFNLWDIDIFDELNNVYNKAIRIFINNDNIAMVELDNGNDVDIEELTYEELLCLYEEIV